SGRDGRKSMRPHMPSCTSGAMVIRCILPTRARTANRVIAWKWGRKTPGRGQAGKALKRALIVRKTAGDISWTSSLFRHRQVRFVDRRPAHAAAPLAVRRRACRRRIVETAGRHDHVLARACRLRHRAVAARAHGGREASRLRQIVTVDEILARDPFELIERYRDVRAAARAGRLAAARAVAVRKADERRSDLVLNRFAEAAAFKRLLGHGDLLLLLCIQ